MRSWASAIGVALVAVLTAGLAGCAADKPKPTALEILSPQIAGRQVWSARLESVQFPLAVAVRDGAFVVAGSDGTVLAIEAQSGRELWRGQVGAKVAAGVGSDGRYAAVVTTDNELVVLNRVPKCGARGWRRAPAPRRW